ncbi:30S ribosomal protein S3 [Yersinia enterocolitica]|nr:30S ribosomal protein S3 [Yersinia enterocolitica]CNF26054.1 30S ribosomal protein S3 [Yersinia enterocolitica]
MQSDSSNGSFYLYFIFYFSGILHDSATEWQSFVDNDVTSRFKDGLTVIDAKGQWLGNDGTVAKENSKALVLIHKADKETTIETLRARYKKQFAQESVMRVDAVVCVDF